MKNLFARIRERFSPVRRADETFGSMLFMGDKLKYWEGRAIFAPQGREIEVFVDGGPDDSLHVQHKFYQDVCDTWAVLRERIEPKLKECYEQATQKRMAVPAWEDFTVDSVSIPASVLDASSWRLSLSAKSDEAHTYWVEMKGLSPEVVSWDS